MSDETKPPVADVHVPSIWSKHRFMLLIAGSITIALLLVSLSLVLYSWSGAAQLDLSRPGYEDVPKDEKRNDTFKGFSQTGTLDKKALDEFRSMFQDQRDNVRDGDIFNPSVLSDESLGIPANQPEETQQ